MLENQVYTELRLEVLAIFAAEDPLQIAHTQAVADYTETIAIMEKLPARQIFLLKTAALLHDVGCPAARASHGKSLPAVQEREGARITRELLMKRAEFTANETDFLVAVVGSHHQFRKAKEIGFEPLFEADLIVNLLEGYLDRSKAALYGEKMVSTPSGKRLFELLFPR